MRHGEISFPAQNFRSERAIRSEQSGEIGRGHAVLFEKIFQRLIRHCIFSTGPFVEPIVAWEPPHRLEFDVSENPPPMKEFSPYGHIDAPHLHDTFVSRHGRFLLREENGKTVLEGTTWYFQRIAPDWYWHRFSDVIIHAIHRRVLEQIKRSAEGRWAAARR
jgi:hypothetical protein